MKHKNPTRGEAPQVGRALRARRGTPGLIGFLLRALLLTTALTIEAATWKVAQSGGGQFTTINAAIEEAKAGDTIEIGPGLYEENVLVSKSLTIRGAGPQYVTIKAAPTSWAVIVVNSVPEDPTSLTLSGVTVTSPESGGVLVGRFNTAVIENCVITGCRWQGVHHSSRGTPNAGSKIYIRQCTFYNNRYYHVDVRADGPNVNAQTYLENSILVGNLDLNPDTQTYMETASSFYAGKLLVSGDGLGSTSSLSSAPETRDPEFVNPPASFVLKETSKAKDKGQPSPTNLDPDGTIADLGAYGGAGAAAFWPYPASGPVVTDLKIDGPVSVPQGAKVKIKASATTR